MRSERSGSASVLQSFKFAWALETRFLLLLVRRSLSGSPVTPRWRVRGDESVAVESVLDTKILKLFLLAEDDGLGEIVVDAALPQAEV